MNDVLFKAILAMDSYNRGYEPGIKFGTSTLNYSFDAPGTPIGTATIYDRAGDDAAKAIGFYGIAYTVGNETVISYRGTDYPAGGTDVPKDVQHGWTLGSGMSYGPAKSQQGLMAIDFYNTVVDSLYGTVVQANDASIAISLTGHSLGGGLGGFVGALYDQDARVFDSMSFELASLQARAFCDTDAGILQDTVLREKIYGLLAPWVDLWNPEFNGIEGYYVEGEILDVMLPFRDVMGTGAELHPTTLGYEEQLSGTQLHSMSSMVIRQFADYGSPTGGALDGFWRTAAQYFWPVLYDVDFAQQIGMADSSVAGENQTQGAYDAILRGIIAYSAIEKVAANPAAGVEESVTVFGDTGIRALYHDANALGSALGVADSYIATFAPQISKTFINFAGLLALHKTDHGSTQWAQAGYTAINGVLTYDPAVASILSINFDNALWTLAGGGVMPGMVGQAALIGDILAATGAEASLRSSMGSLWGNNTTNVFDVVHFARYAESTSTILPTPLHGESALYVGRDGNDAVTGSSGNDLIVTAAGNDVLKGSRGKDILVGGIDSDTADYANLGAFLKVTTLSEPAGKYTIDKYYGQSSATGTTYETDHLYGIEDILGAVITQGSGGMSIDGAGGKIIKGDALNNVIGANGSTDALTLYGYGGNDWLQGGWANDYLVSGEGDDTVRGTRGNDTYVYKKGDGVDIFDDQQSYQSDIDTLVFQGGIRVADLTFARYNNSDVVITFSGGGQVTLASQMGMPIDYLKFGDGTVVDMETVLVPVYGTENGETLYGTNDNGMWREGAVIHDVINGKGGHDILFGNGGIDTLDGGSGNDVLSGGDSGDYLYGDADTDTLYGNDGDDMLYGGDGIDFLYGGRDNDILHGNAGDDKMYGDGGNDVLYGGEGKDTMEGGDDNDTLNGDGENDILYGNAGTDVLYGGTADDTLYGGSGGDTLYGGDGNDRLNGQEGADTLYGGAGADVFLFQATSAYGAVDTIADFSQSQLDKIDLKDLLSLYNPLTQAVTDFVRITDSGANSILSVDYNGGANSFVQIATLSSITGLTDEQSLVSGGYLLVV